MHILQIYKDYPPVLGGIEHHIRDLSLGLCERGFQVTVLVTKPDSHTSIETSHTALRIIRAGRNLQVASTPLSLDFLRQALALQADVIHLHFPYPPGDLAALCVPGSPPLVVTYHSDIVRQKTLLKFYRPLMEHTLGRAAHILATSPDYVQSSPVLQHYQDKVRIIPLGIDLQRFRQLPERQRAGFRAGLRRKADEILLLFVGRLRYYKGLHILLDAMPLLQNVRLLIAGTGSEQAALQSQLATLNLADRVSFLGDVSDDLLPALYQVADMFVLPAHMRSEALGLAQIEAMASGLPCISTRLGTGTTYANIHGVTGLTVPPDDAQALAEAIQQLAGDPELRQRYGFAAHQRTQALFSRQAMLDAVVGVYHSCVA